MCFWEPGIDVIVVNWQIKGSKGLYPSQIQTSHFIVNKNLREYYKYWNAYTFSKSILAANYCW